MRKYHSRFLLRCLSLLFPFQIGISRIALATAHGKSLLPRNRVLPIRTTFTDPKYSPQSRAWFSWALQSDLRYTSIFVIGKSNILTDIPEIAGFFLPKTGYSDSFFLTSIGLIIFTLLYVIFVCPESLDPVEAVVADTTRDDRLQFKTSPILAARSTISRILSSLLSPILMFAPRRVPNSRRWNYSMTLVGLALFSYIVSTVRGIRPSLSCNLA